MSCKAAWRGGIALALLALVSGLPGCSRRPRGVERLAVLRFENLSGDPGLEWVGRALAEALAWEVGGSSRVYAMGFGTLHALDSALGRRPSAVAGISAERSQALLAGATRIAYGEYSVSGGRLRAAVTVEDPETGKVVRAAVAGGREAIETAAALARTLNYPVRPYPTRSAAALRRHAAGLEESDPAAAQALFEGAAKLDPGFGQAWVAAMRAALARGDRGSATRLAAQARAAAPVMAPAERARVDYEAATLAGDAAGRERALRELIRLEPADPGPYRALAVLRQSAHDYPTAAALLREALALHPEDPALLNTAGYAAAYAGDLGAAEDALGRYLRLRPLDPNGPDSLGDARLLLGRLQDAERDYLEAYARSAAFQEGAPLAKAAWARLMAGDAGGAGGIFERYAKARQAAGDDAVEWRRAEWLRLTGRRREAAEALGAFAAAREGNRRDLAAQAHALLAIWALDEGDRGRAREHARRSAALADAGAAFAAAVAGFLAAPPAPAAEWEARAGRAFAASAQPFRDYLLACALLYQRDFAAAVVPLERFYARWTPGGEPGAPVVLAWAYAGSGRPGEAAALVARNPIPQPGTLHIFTSLWFPRLLFLRAETLARQGRAAEAARNYRLFLELSGEGADPWGERARARTALARHRDAATGG